MEAKALTTQDLTTDLTANPTTVPLDAVALTVAAEPALQVTSSPEHTPGERGGTCQASRTSKASS